MRKNKVCFNKEVNLKVTNRKVAKLKELPVREGMTFYARTALAYTTDGIERCNLEFSNGTEAIGVLYADFTFLD
jgi:hypothetical protein